MQTSHQIGDRKEEAVKRILQKKVMVRVLVAMAVAMFAKVMAMFYFRTFGAPVTAPNSKEHWYSVKSTFPEMASDMDSKSIIKERQADIT